MSLPVKETDDEFYRRHPELIDENGERIPLGMGSEHKSLRKEWLAIHDQKETSASSWAAVSAAMSKGDPSAAFQDAPPGAVQCCTNHRIGLRVIHHDGQLVGDLKFDALVTDRRLVDLETPLGGKVLEEPTEGGGLSWSMSASGSCKFTFHDFLEPGKSREWMREFKGETGI